ncbi:tRNA (adenosine(37)-N6)-threonylcarbamoyltransferase complex ATPase subunit type 1 TsaE [Liquorilactobacillus uvarum]|uniref:tRNA threonylcarbamoyladenosine biosynthesis protein TsaE n=1 Tax=Liquorilactobacillus uvarum DSM 19971 TaxID=1423812 RepID=A0A0R1Q386_9LACO|nr:tRNA (adenosine(37)-N6)-threonylcarbamoyltransferase complex ATPase subunit type 1 TsaE [Liquorilactobacillus uvarum]KRL38846.1 ATP GTP hydrolase [Liquorilactobacillus uvarum DSM 19971]
MEIAVHDADETKMIAQMLAAYVKPNDVILLDGDLGAGKTTFTKGLALGLGIEHNVKSPTFNLIKEYHQGKIPLFHMDVYRLEGVGGGDLGLEEYFNGGGVSVIEWSQFIQDELPQEYLQIQIIKNEQDDQQRTLKFTAIGEHFEEIVSLLKEEWGNSQR